LSTNEEALPSKPTIELARKKPKTIGKNLMGAFSEKTSFLSKLFVGFETKISILFTINFENNPLNKRKKINMKVDKPILLKLAPPIPCDHTSLNRFEKL
tara:strand:- start:159 stop:455 length:297 start_codon:yes stop_codon:yes gene_type:complete